MIRKFIITGASVALLVGGGSAAAYAAGSGGPGGSPTAAATSTSTAQHGAPSAHAHRRHARTSLHGSWVTRGPKKTFVTHDEIRGQVTAVSASAITVRAVDDYVQTYTLAGTTPVRQRVDGRVADDSVSQLKVGVRVRVLGVGSPGSPTARHIRILPAR